MSAEAEEVLRLAMGLPDEERLSVAEALLTSVEPPGGAPFDAAWIEEAKRRAARIDSGEGGTRTWAEVRDQARRKSLNRYPGCPPASTT
ncbi:MAG: addiction module protein [Gemmataceae bacterium]|nr:addiction module protein [Gemmataceae bacterium]